LTCFEISIVFNEDNSTYISYNKKVNSITNKPEGVESFLAKASAAEKVDCGLRHEMI
jgi:hypothetical protein